MKRLLSEFRESWFQGAPAERLAMLRILVGIFAVCLVGSNLSMWTQIGYTTPELFKPLGVVSLFHQPLPPVVNQVLLVCTVLLGVPFILGWRYRITGPAFALLLLWVISYRLSWSMVYHSMHLVVLHAIVLGLSPAADALSLDARGRSTIGPGPASAWQYGFPVQLICAVTVCAYFVTGIAKVFSPLGWSWAGGESLRSQVAADAIRKELLGTAGSSLFYRLYHHLWLFTTMGVTTFFVELGAPLALLNKRLGKLWAVSAYLMHWGILFVMAIEFRYHLSGIVFLSFFELERVPAWLHGLRARRAGPLVSAPAPQS